MSPKEDKQQSPKKKRKILSIPSISSKESFLVWIIRNQPLFRSSTNDGNYLYLLPMRVHKNKK